MKNFNKTTFEKDLEKNLQEIKKEALANVGVHVENPNASIESLLGEIRAKIEVLKTKVEKVGTPRVNQLHAAISKMRFNERKAQIEESTKKNKEVLQRVKVDRDRIQINYYWHLIALPVICIGVLVGGDIALNFKSLQILLPNLLSAFVVGVIVAIALGLAADVTASKILTIPQKLRRRLLFTVVNVLVFCLFVFLGFLRMDFYEQQSSFFNNPFSWGLFSLLFFNTAVFVSYMFLPSKEEKEKKKRFEVFDKQCRVLSAELKTDEKELETLREQHANMLTAVAELDAFLKNTLEMLDREMVVIFQSVRREYGLKGGTNVIPFPTIG